MDFVPGPRSIIHIRDFASGEALWQYLESFGPGGAREAEYKDFHAWRASAMETFLRVSVRAVSGVSGGACFAICSYFAICSCCL